MPLFTSSNASELYKHMSRFDICFQTVCDYDYIKCPIGKRLKKNVKTGSTFTKINHLSLLRFSDAKNMR